MRKVLTVVLALCLEIGFTGCVEHTEKTKVGTTDYFLSKKDVENFKYSIKLATSELNCANHFFRLDLSAKDTAMAKYFENGGELIRESGGDTSLVKSYYQPLKLREEWYQNVSHKDECLIYYSNTLVSDDREVVYIECFHRDTKKYFYLIAQRDQTKPTGWRVTINF